MIPRQVLRRFGGGSASMALAVAVACSVAMTASTAGAFVLFESGQVRPLALSSDTDRLFACNTPDNRLEIFDVTAGGLDHVASVPVGLEPVAVAARTNTEVWVVNHLSDSVSIVDLSDIDSPRVVRTLHVGDEPRDIVFGGSAKDRAFITTAHRGQNTPFHPGILAELRTDGIGRADVWVFDAGALGASMGGDELTILTLFGDTPRALAVTDDGSTVYAAAFHSGNRTTVLSEGVIPNGGEGAGGLPEPNTDHSGVAQPESGLIVRFDGAQWVDELARDWSSEVKFDLPDQDVFVIDANANPPIQSVAAPSEYTSVGTVLLNMVVNPANDKVYVANTEAFNEVRFEGPGIFAAGFGGTTVRGHLAESRITVLDPAGGVTPRHLNPHIDYGLCCEPAPNPTNEASLAFPLDMAVTSDGSTLFVAAFGSGKIGIFDTTELEAGTFVPDPNDHISLSGGGPTGLVLDEARMRLYALTRFDNAVSIVSTATGMETSHVPLFNPEPASVVEGRPFLYDAAFTSGNGEQACASCHIFGDLDSLGWDLGDPDGDVLTNPGPFTLRGFQFIDEDHHPMKGPMTTQSLRGMDNHGPMHWRGDRTGGNDVPASAQPDTGAFDEDAAFKKFNVAFPGLVGRSDPLEDEEMQKFTDFILQVMYPPNPIRALDNSLSAEADAGRTFYFGPVSDTVFNCNGCHVLDADGNAGFGVARPGFFGSDGRSSFEAEPQMFKIPHLRNMYQKVGMFGQAAAAFFNPGDNGHKGDQIRGFGFMHDGNTDTLFRFHDAVVFNQNGGANIDGIPVGPAGDPLRRELEAFMLEFDSNHAPIVGQQVSRTATTGAPVEDRIDLLLARADAVPSECDVVVKGFLGVEARGWLYAGGGSFEGDREGDGVIADATLRAQADTAGQELTYTAVPVGEGFRIGLDRDDDGFRDRDELDAGSDPDDPLSIPCETTTAVNFRSAKLKDSKGSMKVKGDLIVGNYDGETLQVTAADGGGLIFDGAVLGEAFEPNKTATSFKFKDPDKQPGISKAGIRVNKNVAGGYRVSIKVKDGWTPPAADESLVTTTVTVNIGGKCFLGNATGVN